jgi:mannosyltransferase OCH1-like enzyme
MSKIPKNIFQTFEHTDFNPHFQKLIDDWKIENPDYNYLIYDKNQREEFIKDNFPSEVWEAYTRIKPGAFKSDLWRYCILHKYGGFYMDIDTVCLGQLDMFISDDIDFVAAIDLNLGDLEFHNVANAFIGCTPEHPVIAQCIQNVITIVDAEALPYNIMNFCGPGCLGMIINKYLGRREKESMVDFQGNHNKIQLIHFERYTEYIRNLNGKKILQNKNNSQSRVKN